MPPPKGDAAAPLKAMLVDSWYDPYLGVVILVRVIDGCAPKGPAGQVHGRTGTTHEVDRVGASAPRSSRSSELGPGEIGFITAQIKEVAETRVGDTITDDRAPPPSRCPASSRPAGGLLRPVPGRRRRLREAARQPLQAAPQRRELQLRDGDSAPRSASASAAASSACSTSRSSRSG
jgi:hypothetical protein